jgi:6-pyruvoyltetrahydropterin/6-carboxytetrahydropterin synthase
VYIIRVEVSFDAGHRLLGHTGKCSSPHGHTYTAEVFVTAEELNNIGLAFDFGDVKSHVKAWIDRNWDHAFLANSADQQLIDALRSVPETRLYLFPDVNPSAEAMAKALYAEAEGEFPLLIQGVRIWESPRQYAEYINSAVPANAGLRQEVLR